MPENTQLVGGRAGIFLASDDTLICSFIWADSVLTALQRDSEEELPVRERPSRVNPDVTKSFWRPTKKEEHPCQKPCILKPRTTVSEDQTYGRMR